MLDLKQFLQQERDLGTYQSEGKFTLSVEQARRKLSRYSLPSGQAWVTKLVQAVVGWRVKRLKVVQSRAHTVFHFQPSLRYGLPTGQDIWNTFIAADVGGRLPLQRFCLALHAIRESENLSFLLSLNDGRGEPALFADGKHLDRADAAGRDLRKYLAPKGMALVVSHLTDDEKRYLLFLNNSQGRDLKRRVDIGQHLATVILASPIEVEYDSFRLDLTAKESKAHKIICVEDIALPGKGVEPILLPTGLYELLQDKNRWGSTWRTDESHLGYVLFRYSSKPRRSCVRWVDDGALLETTCLRVEGRLHMTAVVNGAGLPTDLTGLKLVEGEPRKRRLKVVKNALLTALRSFSNESERWRAHLPAFADRDPKTWKGVVEATASMLSTSVERL